MPPLTSLLHPDASSICLLIVHTNLHIHKAYMHTCAQKVIVMVMMVVVVTTTTILVKNSAEGAEEFAECNLKLVSVNA